MSTINWQPMMGSDARFFALIDGTGVMLQAGQNDDGSIYWSVNGEGKCSAPMYSYKGITDPKAYVAAAIERAKRDAEESAAKLMAAPVDAAALRADYANGI